MLEDPKPLRDPSLVEAVARMTREARQAGWTGLVLTPREWERLVLKCLNGRGPWDFVKEIIHRAEPESTITMLDKWMALAGNIWANAMEAERGGNTDVKYKRERPGSA